MDFEALNELQSILVSLMDVFTDGVACCLFREFLCISVDLSYRILTFPLVLIVLYFGSMPKEINRNAGGT